jgi:glycosyltransferase involved in cell wall biosynthesis
LRADDRIPIIFGLTSGILSGVDVFVSGLVRSLNAAGHDARILFTGKEVQPPPAGVPFDVLSAQFEADWHHRWLAFRDYLTAHSPCVFVASYDTDYSVGLLPPVGGVRVVLTVQSDDPHHYGHVLMIGHACARIIAVSTAIAEHIAVICPGLRERTTVIPNGIGPPPSPPPLRDTLSRPLRAIYAGRVVSEQKNVPGLVHIVARVQEIESLTVIGEGSADVSLLLLSMARGIMLYYKSTMPNSAVLDEFALHDVALLNSSYEGLPLMILEAMGRGCIPICRRVRSGLPELIVHGENGFLYDDPAEVQAFCRSLSRDGEERRRIAYAAYETMVFRESNSLKPYAQYETLLREVLQTLTPAFAESNVRSG